jgi:hypothetical protein
MHRCPQLIKAVDQQPHRLAQQTERTDHLALPDVQRVPAGLVFAFKAPAGLFEAGLLGELAGEATRKLTHAGGGTLHRCRESSPQILVQTSTLPVLQVAECTGAK